MFGVQELEQLKVEIEETIENAKKAEQIWATKQEALRKLLSKEQLAKVAEILEL